MTFPVLDANSATQQLLTGAELQTLLQAISTAAGTLGLTDAQLRASPVGFSASALPLPAGAATATGVAAVVSAVQALAPYLDGLEGQLAGTLAVSAAALPLPAGAATATSQADQLAAVQRIGTRAYGAGVTALAATTSASASAAITTTEVLVHNRSGGSIAFIRAGAGATVNDVPVEPGEKFHLRITSGSTISAITASGTATLNIVPVA